MKIARRVAREVFNVVVVEDVSDQDVCGGEPIRPVPFNRSRVSVPRNENRSLQGEFGIKSHGMPPKLLVVFMGSMNIEDGNGMPLILDGDRKETSIRDRSPLLPRLLFLLCGRSPTPATWGLRKGEVVRLEVLSRVGEEVACSILSPFSKRSCVAGNL
jgi:hypothetical protein